MLKLRSKFLCALFTVLLVIRAVYGASCVYEPCTCLGDVINCQNLGLQEIPPLTGNITGFIYLYMNGNKITTIPAGSLPPGLVNINLAGNPLASIADSSFNGSASTLNTLTISNARLTRIPDAFLCFQYLRDLSITNTNIHDWNEDFMKLIGPGMDTLELNNVSLSEWPDWMKYFTKLDELNINNSNISDIPDNVFDSLATSLTDLSFSNNKLTSVPKAFSKLVQLYSLSLDSNKLSNLTWLPPSNGLTELALNNNKIYDAAHLSSVLRQYGSSLKIIDFYDNQLTEIPDLSFLLLIDMLNFSHNRIIDSNSGWLPPQIVQVDLSYNLFSHIPTVSASLLDTFIVKVPHNIIKEIRGSDFHANVTEADLTYNAITEITDNSFPMNFKILTLDLSNNPITTISNRAFDNLQSLMSLYMTNTRLTRMPLAINSLVGLSYLDLSANSQLICTCMESALSTKILSFQFVNGRCGQTEITFFYKSLSPSCPI